MPSQIRPLLAGLLVVIASSTSRAQVKQAESVPVVCEQPSFSFGKTAIGQKPKHDFILKNNTKQPLTITSVSTSCGCASVKARSKQLPVGSQVKIAVTMNTSKFRGQKSSSIHVRYKEIDFENKLTVEMDISNLEVIPEVVSFKVGLQGVGQATEKMTVRRIGSPYWTIKKIETSSENLVVNSKKRVIDGDIVTFHFTCLWSGGADVANESITLHTNDSAAPKLSIPVRVYPSITGLNCAVKKLEFDLAAGKTKRLLFASEKLDQIQSVTCDNPRVTVEAVESDKESKAHFVTVAANKDPQSKLEPSNNSGKIVVTTKNGSRCEVAIELINGNAKNNENAP